MAVKDDCPYQPTEALILTKPQKHFCISVSPIHWQLRSLISADKRNTVYYPTGNGNLHIQRLDTSAGETETIKLLSFSPRCLVSKNGWICCGGETGEFTAIRVDDWGDAVDLDLPRSLEPDARLSLGLDAPRSDSDGVHSLLSHSRSRSPKSLVAKSKTFGKERVNCITMWFPSSQVKPYEGAYSRGVAVLANNDKHVTIVGLQEQEALDEIDYPDCVNRAVLSPDGKLLIAISDDPYLYVHERVEKSFAGRSTYRSSDRPLYEWNKCRKIHLKSQRRDDTSDNRGSFAACFSSSGRFLAVGTQYGTISVFAAHLLAESDVDPLITTFTSSRPNSELGAIREMAFCPGHFDLLAWTEDRGRVGIADARSNFVARQIIHLDKQDSFENLHVTDRASIDPRLLDTRNRRPDHLASSLASTLDLSPSDGNRGDSGSQTGLRSRYMSSPLTPDETLVLEALQEHRRRRERIQNSATQASNSMRVSLLDRGPRSPLATESSTRERSGSRTRNVSDILENIRDQRYRLRDTQERLRAHIRDDLETERYRYGEASRQVAPTPPRRTTTMAGNASNNGTIETETTYLPPRRTLVSRILASSNGSGSGTGGGTGTGGGGGWADLEALYNLSFDAGSYEGARLPDADMRRRDRASFFGSVLNHLPMRDWEDNPTRRALGAYIASRELPPESDETVGMSWSDDGHVLYVAAEDGIYEFQVNVFGRKTLPSITMR